MPFFFVKSSEKKTIVTDIGRNCKTTDNDKIVIQMVLNGISQQDDIEFV